MNFLHSTRIARAELDENLAPLQSRLEELQGEYQRLDALRGRARKAGTDQRMQDNLLEQEKVRKEIRDMSAPVIASEEWIRGGIHEAVATGAANATATGGDGSSGGGIIETATFRGSHIGRRAGGPR